LKIVGNVFENIQLSVRKKDTPDRVFFTFDLDNRFDSKTSHEVLSLHEVSIRVSSMYSYLLNEKSRF